MIEYYCHVNESPKKIDSSMAEKWLDPDTFVYKGKVYKTDGFTIKEISPEPEGQKELKP